MYRQGPVSHSHKAMAVRRVMVISSAVVGPVYVCTGCHMSQCPKAAFLLGCGVEILLRIPTLGAKNYYLEVLEEFQNISFKEELRFSFWRTQNSAISNQLQIANLVL